MGGWLTTSAAMVPVAGSPLSRKDSRSSQFRMKGSRMLAESRTVEKGPLRRAAAPAGQRGNGSGREGGAGAEGWMVIAGRGRCEGVTAGVETGGRRGRSEATRWRC